MIHSWPSNILAVAMLLLSDCVAGAAEAAARGEWETTVAAAEKEGQLVVYTGGEASETKIEEAFQGAYPRIKVTSLTGRGSQLGPRIIAERRAEKYLVDFFIGGKGTAYAVLYPAKVLAPIQPLLVVPEVLDQSKWWQGKHKYVDVEGKYIFAFVGSGSLVEIRYNTKLVNPREFTTYWDLLNPKWKGKIAATDPRMAGMDTPVLFFYYHSKLGPEFMRRLYGEMDVTLARDYRQPIDWLGAGKFAVCIPCNTRETEKALKQGLPLGQTVEPLKEGGTLTSGGGTLSFIDKAPHPPTPPRFSSTGSSPAKAKASFKNATARTRSGPTFPSTTSCRKTAGWTAWIISTATMPNFPTAARRTSC